MTINEMIEKFELRLAMQNGVEGLAVYNKPTKKQIEELKASKPDIIAELKRREAEKKAKEEAERAAKEQEKADIISGAKKITVKFYDGEYLSGYTTAGNEASLLKDLGAAHDVSGWGTLVDSKLVEALGEEFTYQQAVEFMAPKVEKAKKEELEKAIKEEKRIAEIFATAKATGKKQVLYTYSTSCNDPEEECNVDIVTVYAMPDGTETKVRNHTW